MCIHCEKKRLSAQLFDLHGRVRMQIFFIRGRVCIQPVPQFPMFGFERHVSTQCVDYNTCSCACSHTERPPPPMKNARRAAAAGHKTTQRRRRPPVRRRTAL